MRQLLLFAYLASCSVVSLWAQPIPAEYATLPPIVEETSQRDGSPWLRTFRYEQSGRTVYLRRDRWRNGAYRTIYDQRFTYNSRGRLVRQIDREWNGESWRLLNDVRLIYDERGNVSRRLFAGTPSQTSPNPAASWSFLDEQSHFQLYTSGGRLVYQETLGPGEKPHLRGNHLAAGVYIYRLVPLSGHELPRSGQIRVSIP